MKIDSSKTITTMSWENEPIAVVNAGEVLMVKTLDCFSNKITSENLLLKDIPWNEVNPATGPIYVNGAEKGDALRISILDIKTENRAAILCESPDLQLYECNGNSKTLFADILNGNVHISDQIVISQAPMIGVLGTAPENGNIPTTLPGVHGGNMDNTHITIGSVVYLPVFHKGALLALGDLHAAMGDGESTGSGFEVGGEVTLKIDVVKQCDFPLPMVKTERVIETVASASSLDAASILAVKNMMRYLTNNLNVELDTAWKLVAACGDVGICQFANDIKTARCSLPIKYLPSLQN